MLIKAVWQNVPKIVIVFIYILVLRTTNGPRTTERDNRAQNLFFVCPLIHVLLSRLPAGESSFIKSLVNFDKDNISDRVLKKTGQYCTQADFQPEIIGRVSLAAKSLCMWVRAMEVRRSSHAHLDTRRYTYTHRITLTRYT